MLPYWILFIVPAFAALSEKAVPAAGPGDAKKVRITGGWLLVMLILVTLIGFRDRVGGDWFNYFIYLFRAEYMTVGEAMRMADPAYEVLNVLSVRMGLGIVGVNLFCGAVFSLGLIVFVRSTPRPWLALAVAIPYMTVVVSMGYARQGVALGFAMIGLVALGRERFLWFAFWILLAASFHRSAVLLIGIALLNLDFRRLINLPLLLVVAFALYVTFLEDQADDLIELYIENNVTSDGAFVRLLMNLVPALLFIFFRSRFDVPRGEKKIYFTMSLLAVISFGALVVGLVPSTAIDRMALYIIPLQVFVFAHLPDSLGRTRQGKKGIAVLILFFYALAFFVWVNFANFSHWWLPYRMFPPLDIYEASRMGRGS